MRIQPINVSKHRSTTFGVKISPELQEKLVAETVARGDDLKKLSYKIAKVERWGNPNALLGSCYSTEKALNCITMRLPKSSKRVYATITYAEKVSDAFKLLSEGLIKKSEKILLDTICKYDN